MREVTIGPQNGNGEKIKKSIFGRFVITVFCFSLVVGYISLRGQLAISQDNRNGQGKVDLDVPYEPSSEEVVLTMIDLAKVGKDDTVYDLGCGDGRIVITASQKTGAVGVGVDLDPDRIKESLDNARKGNMTDRVKFFQQNLFQTEISQATVVMLYLYPEVNLKLRPKLLRELKAGARVVSHSHDMGSWEPDETRVASNGHRIHFWVIPANVSGAWKWNMPGEKAPYILKLNQQFQKASGTLHAGSYEIPVKNLRITGDRVEFGIERMVGGQVQKFYFSGRNQGHFLEGTIQGMNRASRRKRPWKATRDPSSIRPLDG